MASRLLMRRAIDPGGVTHACRVYQGRKFVTLCRASLERRQAMRLLPVAGSEPETVTCDRCRASTLYRERAGEG